MRDGRATRVRTTVGGGRTDDPPTGRTPSPRHVLVPPPRPGVGEAGQHVATARHAHKRPGACQRCYRQGVGVGLGVASGNAAVPTTHTAVTAAPLQPRPLSPAARSTIATPPQCQRHRHWEPVRPVQRRVSRGTAVQGWSGRGHQKQGTCGVGVGAGVQGGGE